MSIYKVKLERKQEVAAGTMAFYFEKPKGFAFKAGQYGDLTLINPAETDAEGNIRGFSLANAPHEDFLMFATRMRDTAFKRVLRTMEPGTELTLDAPGGSFTLHNNASIPAVFLTGGIGITPSEASFCKPRTTSFPTRFSCSIPITGRKTLRSWTSWWKLRKKIRITPLSARCPRWKSQAAHGMGRPVSSPRPCSRNPLAT